MISARNQVPGQITAVKLGAVAAEVVISAAGVEIVAAITRASAERMKLAAGDRVTAVIKASDVMIAKD
ncbi:MAG TPA: TOBE domain-containing protein [Pirellulales bacterium]|nr:TOBE domain-containing protein [Pirellulales bacterium]